ncbi:hypothetical protein ACFL2D_02515 [Patescibacteria group bacterium]
MFDHETARHQEEPKLPQPDNAGPPEQPHKKIVEGADTSGFPADWEIVDGSEPYDLDRSNLIQAYVLDEMSSEEGITTDEALAKYAEKFRHILDEPETEEQEKLRQLMTDNPEEAKKLFKQHLVHAAKKEQARKKNEGLPEQ